MYPSPPVCQILMPSRIYTLHARVSEPDNSIERYTHVGCYPDEPRVLVRLNQHHPKSLQCVSSHSSTLCQPRLTV